MKTRGIRSIAGLLLLGLLLIIYSCQKDETASESQLQLVDAKTTNKNKKVDVCHNDHVINISINALPAHQRHGDAIDLDGDGYFDIDNSCSETDCNDEDPNINPGIEGSCEDEPGVAELLVGVWTSTEIDINPFVGTQTLLEYLIGVVGLTPEDAEALVDEFIASLEPELTGSLTINSDNTYESDFVGGSDMGTWGLSADEMTLTLFEGAETIVITINSITETAWYATLSDDFLVDVDGEPSTPEVMVTVIANVVLTK